MIPDNIGMYCGKPEPKSDQSNFWVGFWVGYFTAMAVAFVIVHFVPN
jgi:hypothetical protein